MRTRSAVAVGATLALLLTASAAEGAFSKQSTLQHVRARYGTWCAGGFRDLTATQDAYVDTGAAGNVFNVGSMNISGTTGPNRFYRSYVLFPAPSPVIPAGCAITSEVLTLTRSGNANATARTIFVTTIGAVFNQTTLTWNNQPAEVTPVASTTCSGGSGSAGCATLTFTWSGNTTNAWTQGLRVRDSSENGVNTNPPGGTPGIGVISMLTINNGSGAATLRVNYS